MFCPQIILSVWAFFLLLAELYCCHIVLSLPVQSAQKFECFKLHNMGRCFSSNLLFFKSLYIWVKFQYITWLSIKTNYLYFIGASLDFIP